LLILPAFGLRLFSRPAASGLLLQRQHGAVIAPDTLPLHHEPRRELARVAAGKLGLQALRADPTPREDLTRIDPDRVRRVTDEHGTQFLLGAGRVKLRLILKLEQEV